MKTLIVLLISLFAGLQTGSAQSLDFSPNHNLVLCGPTDVYFVCQSSQTINNIWWDFGDGQAGIGLNAVHRYTQPGVYDVKMVVEYNSLKDSVTKLAFVTLNPLPEVTFTISDVIQIPYVRIFTAKAAYGIDSIVSYRWKVGSLVVSELPKFKYTFPGNDVYTVSLEVANQSGCSLVLDSVIEINDNPIPQTGVAELGTKNFSCMVAPDGKSLMIERNNGCTEILQVRILDITGRLLHDYTLAANLSRLYVDLPSERSTLCVVELSSQSFEAVLKLDPRYL